MALDQETINAQQELLAVHRRTLAVYLRQQAQFGALAPPGVFNGIAEAQSTIRRIKEQLRSEGVPVEDEPNDVVQPPAIAAPSRLSPQDQRNRRAMLAKVKTIWIDGLLEQSLAKELRITLDLTEQPDLVALPLNTLVQELNRPARTLPAGTPIIDVFDQIGGALLILGAPGAGKTTLLLELARDLIARAEQDEGHPIPVVFNLSSWAEQRRLLKEWLAEELNTKYDVPRKVAQEWTDMDVVLPLMDGLDEVAADHREACVAAINGFRHEHGLVPLAVSSRLADYETQATKLRLQSALAVQPLTKQQVDTYLEQAGEKLAGVRVALRDDTQLSAVLDTPLMLSIVTLAYAGKTAEEVEAVMRPEERWQQLFDDYIAAMFRRRGREARYSQQETLRWLGWLAQGMTQQAQTVWLVERLQAAWLTIGADRREYVLIDRSISGLAFGLVFGLVYGLAFGSAAGLIDGLAFGLAALFFGGQIDIETLRQRPFKRAITDALAGWLVFGLVSGLVFGLGFGPIFGLLGGLGSGLLGGLLGVLTGKPGAAPRQVIVIERLRWVGSKAWRSAVGGLIIGMVTGLVGGLSIGLVIQFLGEVVFGQAFGLPVRLGQGPVGGLGLGLLNMLSSGLIVGLIGGLLGGLSSGPLTATIQVNQGIRRSARSALVCGLIFALICGLSGAVGGRIFGLVFSLLFGLLGALGGGLSGALAFGGYACLSHFALRLVLARNGSLPLRLVPFLDYCVDRIFLRRVGGGYIFVHRLLMEHFASLYTEQQERSRRT